MLSFRSLGKGPSHSCLASISLPVPCFSHCFGHMWKQFYITKRSALDSILTRPFCSMWKISLWLPSWGPFKDLRGSCWAWTSGTAGGPLSSEFCSLSLTANLTKQWHLSFQASHASPWLGQEAFSLSIMFVCVQLWQKWGHCFKLALATMAGMGVEVLALMGTCVSPKQRLLGPHCFFMELTLWHQRTPAKRQENVGWLTEPKHLLKHWILDRMVPTIYFPSPSAQFPSLFQSERLVPKWGEERSLLLTLSIFSGSLISARHSSPPILNSDVRSVLLNLYGMRKKSPKLSTLQKW